MFFFAKAELLKSSRTQIVSGYSRNPCSLNRERDAALNASGTPPCVTDVWSLYRITPIHWLMAQRRLWRNHVVSSYWRTRHPLLRFLCRKEPCRQREELGSECSVSFPIQRTRVTRVTRDVLFHRWTQRCVERIGNDIPNTPSWKRCLSGPIMNQQHTVGLNRQDLRTWSRINVKVVKLDKGVRRGPSCRNTNILQGYPSKESLRGSYAPSRMRPETKRWRKVLHLISQRNGVSHPVGNPLLWRGKPAAANTKTHQ